MSSTESRLRTSDLLKEQLDYYRARAPEYDEWWFRKGRYDRALNGEWTAEAGEVSSALSAFRPAGRVLELACGTGLWSERLVRYATELVALDASSEMLSLNAARLGNARVRYIHADLFQWQPSGKFDVVFFGFWLSHVPPDRFESFWKLVESCLTPGGRVFFVDSCREETSTASDHRLPAAGSSVMSRRLNDGHEFRIFKVFYEPKTLTKRLASLGWAIEVKKTHRYFVFGFGGRLGA